MGQLAADRRAEFEAVVCQWQGPVGRFLARLTADRERAADLTQETFLRAYLAWERYRDEGQVRPWLYRIALNQYRDALRKKTLPTLAEPAAACPHAGPGELAERGELAARVLAALAKLPTAWREVVVLRHYEQMNFEEMARLVDVPASTLKSRFGV